MTLRERIVLMVQVYTQQLLLKNTVYIGNSKSWGDIMRYLFHKTTLFIMGFLSFCLIVVGFLLQTILIPLQDFDLISKTELLELQKELALNYPLGIVLLYLGIFSMTLVLILFIMKVINTNKESDI